ncbi:MAG: ABC-F family ATP-binding cassette domain-containing protein [Phycisphaerae bacterium]|nr:ABC-F family ATP-binding cassette domain-containing protein [Phycisphaerae bacterium]
MTIRSRDRPPVLLVASNVARSHGVRELFHGVCLSVDVGERVALIGPNGAGKSTLLRTLAGQEPADAGEVRLARGVQAVYVPQHDVFQEGLSSLDACAHAALRSAQVHGDLHDATALSTMLLGRIGFDAARMEQPAQALSGGWKKRLSVACALASAGGAPDLLLLDEPTNHLDVAGLRWLELFLLRGAPDARAGACVFVTHDRSLLQAVATRVVELSSAYEQGTFQAEGDYEEFVRRRSEFLSGQARAEEALANEVRQDNVWLSRGAQARRTKSKGRIEDSADRRAELSALSARNSAATAGGASVDFNATGRRTRKLIAAKHIAKSMGGRLLFHGVDLELTPGTCTGLMGPNGSGKTTLLRVLTQALPPDSGSVVVADPAPRIVVLTQLRQELSPSMLLREVIGPPGDVVQFRDRQMHITAWSRRFLFRDEQLIQPLSSLSGGELARAHIARMMLEPADVLVLDEPTNDLDITTLEVLEESVESFPGAVLLVTHDRAMLERLADSIVVLGGPEASVRIVASVKQALNALDESERGAANAVRERVREASSQAAPDAPQGAPSRKRLGYMEQREFDGMEARILKAEAAVHEAEAHVSKPEVSADHVALAKACRVLEVAQAEVAALYARWAELEAKRT